MDIDAENENEVQQPVVFPVGSKVEYRTDTDGEWNLGSIVKVQREPSIAYKVVPEWSESWLPSHVNIAEHSDAFIRVLPWEEWLNRFCIHFDDLLSRGDIIMFRTYSLELVTGSIRICEFQLTEDLASRMCTSIEKHAGKGIKELELRGGDLSNLSKECLDSFFRGFSSSGELEQIGFHDFDSTQEECLASFFNALSQKKSSLVSLTFWSAHVAFKCLIGRDDLLKSLTLVVYCLPGEDPSHLANLLRETHQLRGLKLVDYGNHEECNDVLVEGLSKCRGLTELTFCCSKGRESKMLAFVAAMEKQAHAAMTEKHAVHVLKVETTFTGVWKTCDDARFLSEQLQRLPRVCQIDLTGVFEPERDDVFDILWNSLLEGDRRIEKFLWNDSRTSPNKKTAVGFVCWKNRIEHVLEDETNQETKDRLLTHFLLCSVSKADQVFHLLSTYGSTYGILTETDTVGKRKAVD